MDAHAATRSEEPRHADGAPVPDVGDGTMQERAPLVYLVVALGLTITLVCLLLETGDGFGLGTMLAALAVAVPYLVYARLALVRSGPETVAGGVLLLATGGWGAVDAVDPSTTLLTWIVLAASLLVLTLAVFALGAFLRRAAPRRPVDDDV